MVELGAAQAFLREYAGARVVMVPHPDADGLSGAAILWRMLTGDRQVVCPEKGESVHGETFRARLRELAPEALIVIDQGSRNGALLPGTPTLTIDHHYPSGVPDGVYLNSYPGEPSENASLLCYRLTGEPPEWLWLGALGIIGDYSLQAPFPEMQLAQERYTLSVLREVVALVNAARRSSRYDWQTALHALQQANDPRQLAGDLLPQMRALRQDQEEVRRELQRARRTRPHFADPWAILPFASPCLIHGLVAAAWTNRLLMHYVVAANYGYRPGYVHFSVRAASNVDLIAALRGLAPEGMPGEWGHGHHAATGGAITRAEFRLLLNRMGFTPEQIVNMEHGLGNA